MYINIYIYTIIPVHGVHVYVTEALEWRGSQQWFEKQRISNVQTVR